MPPKAKKSTPKKAKKMATPPVSHVTLEEAIDGIDNLPNAEGSKRIWSNNLISLVHFSLPPDERGSDSSTYDELRERYANVDIGEIISDYNRTTDIIENQIVNKTNGKAIAIDTKKQYYFAILALCGRGGTIKLPDDVLKEYRDKKTEFEVASHNNRKLLDAKNAGVLLYPDMIWETFKYEYEDFIDKTPFTNTVKGRKDLRQAVVVGFYILQRPRRVEDYASLQYYSKLPSNLDNKNIVHISGDTATIYIDMFKTRWRVKGTSKKEILPRYVKELNPKLTSLLKDYIKKSSITDMSKVKEKNKQYYLFPKESVIGKETGSVQDAYDSGAFSKYISACLKAIYDKPKLSVNTLRHKFEDWIARHIQEYNELQLEEIALDVGDKSFYTQMRYRQSNVENRNKTATEIQGDIERRREADVLQFHNLFVEGVESGDNNEHIPEGDEEVNQPVPKVVARAVDVGMEDLVQKWLTASMAASQAQAEIFRRLLSK